MFVLFLPQNVLFCKNLFFSLQLQFEGPPAFCYQSWSEFFWYFGSTLEVTLVDFGGSLGVTLRVLWGYFGDTLWSLQGYSRVLWCHFGGDSGVTLGVLWGLFRSILGSLWVTWGSPAPWRFFGVPWGITLGVLCITLGVLWVNFEVPMYVTHIEKDKKTSELVQGQRFHCYCRHPLHLQWQAQEQAQTSPS